MDISTPKNLLLIGNPPDSIWATILRDALYPLGQLDLASESETSMRVQQKHYDLVIIDAAVLNNVETLVASLHRQQPTVPIVVVTTSPTWQRARRIFLAGATDYVQRSLDANTLLTTFQAILAKSVSND